MIKNFLKRNQQLIRKYKYDRNKSSHKPEIPDGIYTKCDKCGKTLHTRDVIESSYVCPECNFHFRMRAVDRINMVTDEFVEFNQDIKTKNVLNFPNYEEKIDKLVKKNNINEAVITGTAKLSGNKFILCVMDSYFLMGSMGAVVGEKITQAIERATKKKLPIIIFNASGGARMQEGIISLMQMAKTSAALARHHKKGLLYISVLTNPTTGGVTASYASLGDIILAEPGALIGFAGPRVIEQTIKQDLPEGFQRSEFLLERGFIDKIVHRSDMKMMLTKLLNLHKGGK